MKNQITPKLKKTVKYLYLLTLAAPLLANAEERSGLTLNGSIATEYSDNVLNNINKISDTALIAEPNVKYLGYAGKHKFKINYDSKLSSYSKNSQLNYNEHILLLGAYLDITNKINTELSFGFDKVNETPGITNSTTQTLTDFNKYKNKSALASFFYGQRKSIGQIVLSYKYNDREYTNNQQEFRNYESDNVSATFYYRIAPKTRLLFQASTTEYEYNDQQLNVNLVINQSSNEKKYLAGVEWEATAKTTGLFQIGYQNKNYDDQQLNDISGLSYNLDMIWKPYERTKIKLSASRKATESALLNESGFLSTSYGIEVSHNITTHTSVTSQYKINNDDIITNSNRTDKRNNFSLGVNHSLRNWLNIKLAYKFKDKSSSIEQLNFESNMVLLSLETAFN